MPLVFGDILAAIGYELPVLQQGGFFLPGPYGGMLPPKPIAGISMGVLPYGYSPDNLTITQVSGTIYYVPFPVFRTTTFAGYQIYDDGSTTGKHSRVAIYTEASGGGPGALLKDFGVVTHTGSAGVLQAASSVTVTGPQMCYLAILSDASAVRTMSTGQYFITSVGYVPQSMLPSLLGDIGGTGLNKSSNAHILGWSVASSYGAFNATAVAPTANIFQPGPSTTTGTVAAIELYL